MIRILDRLMVSDLSEANDPFYLKSHQIQAILYFGDGGMFGDDIKLYHRPALADGTLAPDHLRDGIDFLRESLRAGRRVLAVGSTGATIVAAYLAEMGMSTNQALELLAKGAPRVQASAIQEHGSELERRSSINLHKFTV